MTTPTQSQIHASIAEFNRLRAEKVIAEIKKCVMYKENQVDIFERKPTDESVKLGRNAKASGQCKEIKTVEM